MMVVGVGNSAEVTVEKPKEVTITENTEKEVTANDLKVKVEESPPDTYNVNSRARSAHDIPIQCR